MKKLLFIFAIAGALVACNNDADSTENTKDSIDSVANQTTDAIDSSADTRIDMVDSTADAMKDSVEKKDSANN
jgi:hypothetical protein